MKVLSFLENQKNPFFCRRGIGSLKTPITFDGSIFENQDPSPKLFSRQDKFKKEVEMSQRSSHRFIPALY